MGLEKINMQNIMAALKQGAASGVLASGYGYAPNNWYVRGGALSAPTFGRQIESLEKLFALAQPGDVAFLGPGEYDEPNLVIPERLSNFTLIGMGGRGSAFVEPSLVGAAGIQVLADDVTFVNMGVASEATGAFSLKIGSQTVSPARFRAYQCKFEGNEAANPGGQVVLQGCGDTILEDCEIAWGVNGIIGDSNDDGFPTQTLIRRCWFHDLTTVHVGVGAAEHFVEIWMYKNKHMRDEAGVAPTDFILLSDNANIGHMAENQFANATNATGVITIGTGILYGPNGTEAGWSTARPA